MSLLAERLVAIHESLAAAGLPHAVGGAIAYGYCVPEPRGTRDLDFNIFVDAGRAAEAFAALPAEVSRTRWNIESAERDGQVRLWWEDTPVDIFLNNLPFHEKVAKNIRHVPFMGRRIPVLDCTDLAIFKAMFDRTKDWADIEAMVEAGKVDVEEAATWLREFGGANATNAERMLNTGAEFSAS